MGDKARDPRTGRYIKTGITELSVSMIDDINAVNVNEALNHHPYHDLMYESLKQTISRQSVEITNLQNVIKTKDALLEDRRKLIDSRDNYIDEIKGELSLSSRDLRIAVWVGVLLLCGLFWREIWTFLQSVSLPNSFIGSQK